MNKNEQHIAIKQIGLFLKFERMRKNISIGKIAAELNLNPSTIVSIEDGKHQASFIKIYMILSYLKINLDDLFEKIKF